MGREVREQKPLRNDSLGNARGGGRPTKRIYSKAEVAVHRRAVEQLYQVGASPRETQRLLAKGSETITPLKLGIAYIQKLRDRICEEWLQQDETDKRGSKAAQVRRLYQLRAKAAGSKNVRDSVLVEQEIAKLLGHYAPIKVEAEVVQTQALKLVISQLRPEDLEQQYAAAKSMMDDAKRARLMAPVVIEGHGEEVPAGRRQDPPPRRGAAS